MLSPVFMLALSATSPVPQTWQKEFDIEQTTLQPLLTESQTYFRGTLSSDAPLQSALIVDQQGQVVKQLLRSGQKEAEIFWLADKAGRYQIEIQPFAQQNAHISLNLNKLALKSDQRVLPQHPLLSPLLQQTHDAIVASNVDAESLFWQRIEQVGTPLIEPIDDGQMLLTFLWRGEADNVRLLGSPYDGHVHLARLANSTIWYKSYVVPAQTRLSYRLAPNVPQIVSDDSLEAWREQRRAVLATAGPDPLNHNALFAQDDTLFSAASTVTLPKALSDEITRPQGNLSGQVTTFHYDSAMLNNRRTIHLYQPHARYAVTSASPLLILFDGDAYLGRASVPMTLDNLIAQKKIPPLRAVFINNPLPSLRAKELTPNARFADFMADEFKPWLCQAHGICPKAEETILSGSSFGGLASMAIAFHRPDAFGKVLSQSGSFWWGENPHSGEWLTQQFALSERKDVDIYMNAGVFEVSPDSANILKTNQKLHKVLKEKGYSVVFEQVAGGHDYFSWRVMLAQGLAQFFNQDKKE
ncbi:enterochelin esterase [Vibrio cidicii]|uniref:enterochelin esterase n=1 Tax=Vibrio cidicii TaxID=1763883 RepID=UPI003F51782A